MFYRCTIDTPPVRGVFVQVIVEAPDIITACEKVELTWDVYCTKVETIPTPAPKVEMYDFGGGLVPAHQHVNGGGWVANTADVADTAYVGPNARVSGYAQVSGYAHVSGNAQVSGYAQVWEYTGIWR